MAEVLVGLLQKDPNSYLYLNAGWKPAPAIAPVKGQFTVADFLKFAQVFLRRGASNPTGNLQREYLTWDTQCALDLSRRSIGRRLAAAGMAVAAALMLASCDGQGGGYIGAPSEGSPIFNGDANFGFNFQCEAGVKGEITYHDSSTPVAVGASVPGLRMHGTVENVLVDTTP